MKSLRSIAVGAGLLMGLSVPALASTYTLTNCSNGLGCGTGNDLGTITTTNITGGVDVSISLAAGEVMLGNFSPSVMFDLNNISLITYGGTYPSGTTTIKGKTVPTGWTPAPGDTQAKGTFNPDGIGTYNYGLTWNGPNGDGNGAKNNAGTTLDFHVLGAGITTASFTTDTNPKPNPPGTPFYFAVDIAMGCTGIGTKDISCANTGFAGATLKNTGHDNPTPLPAALPLMGSVLGAGYLMSLFRRRRNGSASEPLPA
jgi:hypothetical protein